MEEEFENLREGIRNLSEAKLLNWNQDQGLLRVYKETLRSYAMAKGGKAKLAECRAWLTEVGFRSSGKSLSFYLTSKDLEKAGIECVEGKLSFSSNVATNAVRTAFPEEIIGKPSTLLEEYKKFIQALKYLPEIPSNLQIEAAGLSLMDIMEGIIPGQDFSLPELHKKFEWTPDWSGLKPAKHEKVKKLILEVEGLNKPQKNLLKRADALRRIGEIKSSAEQEVVAANE